MLTSQGMDFCPACAVQLVRADSRCDSEGAVDEKDWRSTYAQLLKQLREMRRQLARVQTEAHVVRHKAALEREKLKSVRTERRATGRFTTVTEPDKFIAYRKRRKKR
jgi:hypothetical protein